MAITTNDLATIFSLEWYRDFPLNGQHRDFGSRSDWTQHIALSFRNSISAFGFFTWFETQGRYDAVAKDNAEVIRVLAEWEWDSPAGEGINEIEKLSQGSGTESPDLCFLLTYSSVNSVEEIVESIASYWSTTDVPLLLALVTYEGHTCRIFKQLKMFEITATGSWKQLREQPALPWEVTGSKWMIGVSPV